MDLERNLVESCVKATDRDIFSSHTVDIVGVYYQRTTALGLVFMTSQISRVFILSLVQEIT